MYVSRGQKIKIKKEGETSIITFSNRPFYPLSKEDQESESAGDPVSHWKISFFSKCRYNQVAADG